jgi:hypothetical protein
MGRTEPLIDGYRAYRMNSPRQDVRVRIMDQERMLRLGLAMDAGRAVIQRDRSRRRRATTA